MNNDLFAGLSAVTCVGFVLTVTVGVLFVRTLQEALRLCSPDNREMTPEQVWWNLAPIINVVYIFVTVDRVAKSLRKEFQERDLDDGGDYGRLLGVGMMLMPIAVFPIVHAALSSLDVDPWRFRNFQVSARLGIASLTFALFVGYWAKIASYNRRLRMDNMIRE
jgi:hypothetical protein